MSENTAKKALFIAEKPSVAREFAKALKYNMRNCDGYMESNEAVITWCVGHLVTMSYPEVYREELKRWSFNTLPFIPEVSLRSDPGIGEAVSDRERAAEPSGY